MSGLIKYRSPLDGIIDKLKGQQITKPALVNYPTANTNDIAASRWRPSQEVSKPMVVVDLLRTCANEGRDYAARYQFVEGRWRFCQSARAYEGFHELRYRSGVTAGINSCDLQEEDCAYCKASGFAVHCFNCNRIVCRGRVSREYFACCCGAKGKIVVGNCRCVGKVLA